MRFLTGIICLLTLASTSVRADIDHAESFLAICALFPNGQYQSDGSYVLDAPDIYYINIPTAVPGEDNTGTFGSAVNFSGDDGRIHACGNRYDYAVVQIDIN